MTIQELVNIGTKTTMKIGGQARYYAELQTKADAEEAWNFAQEKGLPLIPLGAGANTIFADGVVEALVVRILAHATRFDGSIVTAEAGTILASLIMECAKHNLDLSALTGIPGTLGGAIFGNAGQGPKGIWIGSFVESVTAFVDGSWQAFTKEECDFRYRESAFKTMPNVILWEATLTLPPKPQAEILAVVELLLKKRMETQPFKATAGSCFKAAKGTPAWQLIDTAGLRGTKVGGIQVSEKHANFLLNVGGGTFDDVVAITRKVRAAIPGMEGIEMRLYGKNGRIAA